MQRKQDAVAAKHEDNGFNVIQVWKPLTFACTGGDFLKQ